MSRWIAWLVAGIALVGVGCGGDGGGSKERPRCTLSTECEDGNVCSATGECQEPSSAVLSASAVAEGATVEISVIGPDGMPCAPVEGCAELPFGSRVTFRAPAVPGHRFVGWQGGACTGSSLELIIESLRDNARCIARYARRTRVSAASEGGAEGLSARSDAPSARCSGAVCEVDVGTEVVLVAGERPNARFVGWTGAGCTGSAPSLRLTAREADITCSATYAARVEVTATTAGLEQPVALASDSQGAACEPGRCTIDLGAAVTLTAPASAGFRFTGWSGSAACTGTDPVLRIAQVTASESCTASYVPRRTVSASSEGAMPAPLVMVRSEDAFASCTPGACEIDQGGSAALIAPSAEGYRLSGWTGARCEGQVASAIDLRDVTENVMCVAQYARGIAVSGAVLGAVGEVAATSTGEYAKCSRGSCVIDVGGDATLTAPTLEGFRFLGWEGDEGCKGQEPALTFTGVMASKTCYARYATRYRVRGTVAPEAAGTVTAKSASAAAACAGDGCSVDAGGEVVLEAKAAANQRFTGWSGGGACTGQSAMLTISDVRTNVTCTANFVGRFVVAGAPTPAAGGSVSATSSSTGAMCMGGGCTVDAGARVVLTAAPAAGYRFAGWSECATAMEPMLALDSVSRSLTCRANFVRETHVVTIQRNVAGGDVAITLPAPACMGATCTKTVVVGTMVSIEARPAANYAFGGWTGCAGAGDARTATITVTGPTTCTANFVRTFRATVAALHDAAGGYAPMPAESYTASVRSTEANCTGTTCTVPAESAVTFSAAPANGSGWVFERFECTGTTYSGRMGSFSLTIAADTNCVAYFRAPPTYYVGGLVFLNGVYTPTSGTVTASSTSRWATCSGAGCTVISGTAVRLLATGIGNVSFQNWTCGGQTYTTPEITVTAADAAINCEANFMSN